MLICKGISPSASSAIEVCEVLGASILAIGVIFRVASGLPIEDALEDSLPLPGFLDPSFDLRGGVSGTFSVVLLLLAFVGRIIRARKLSSTLSSFFVVGWSLADCLGGGPMLGRGRLAAELCLLGGLPAAEDTPEVRLAGRA